MSSPAPSSWLDFQYQTCVFSHGIVLKCHRKPLVKPIIFLLLDHPWAYLEDGPLLQFTAELDSQ